MVMMLAEGRGEASGGGGGGRPNSWVWQPRAGARFPHRAPLLRARAAAGARVMNLGTDLYEDLYEKLSV
jgi:hypothetical protein